MEDKMKHRIVRFSAIAALSVVLAAGCGESGPSASEVCTKRAQVVCAKRSECSRMYDIQRSFGTMQNCEAWEKQGCLESVERTGSGNTPARAEKCTLALMKQSCDDRAAGVDIPECETSKGDFKDGTACISSNQCSSSRCDVPLGMPCGKCATRLGEGGMCDSSGDCVEGLYCSRDPLGGPLAVGKCAKRQAPGMPCNAMLQCVEGDQCVGFNPDMGLDGTCRARTQKENDPCNDEKRCVSGLTCVGFSRSGMIDGLCKKPVSAENEMCDRNNRMLPTCEGRYGLYCFHVNSMDPTGTCKKLDFVKTGETCGTLADRTQVTCQNGDTCQRMIDPITNQAGAMGVCVARAASGGTCNTNGNVGPGCPVGHSCVLKTPGLGTEGTCVKRDYEMTCKKK
jgi:hypothetical protein